MELLYRLIASAAGAYHRCVEANNEVYAAHWHNALYDYGLQLPRGSGIDSGTSIDVDGTRDDIITLNVPYHHMCDGYYRGWWQYQVTVIPTFDGISVGVECLDAPEEDSLDDYDFTEDDYISIVDECAIESTCEYLSDVYHDTLCQMAERYEREDN